MIGKKEHEYPELLSFKHMAIWLLAYKLYRDYFEVVMFGQRPEPEKFFDEWSAHFATSTTVEERNAIWMIFIKLMVARAAMTR